MASTDGVAPAAAEPMALEVLAVIRDAHAQHGVRHSDYVRYTTYCTRKLHRLRAAANFQQAKGRKYTPKPVTAEKATSVSALLIVLFQAERDWSFAMAVKQDVGTEPHKRLHAVKRLRRAAQHAHALAAICEALGARCTPRTVLDAQAYHRFLAGSAYLEGQHWQQALDELVQARVILAGLAETGNAEQRAVCNARIEEVDPAIRYSAYNLGQLSGGGDERELAELIRTRMAAAGASDAALATLASRLEALAAQEGGPVAALQEIPWAGQQVPVQNASVAALLAAIDAQRAAALAKPTATEVLAGFDKLLSTCSDAATAALADLKTNEAVVAKSKSAKSDEATLQLRHVHAFASFQRLLALADRTLLVIEQTLRRIPGELVSATLPATETPARSGGRQKPAKLEDIVHHYDQLLQNWTEMGTVTGVNEDLALARAIEGRIHLYHAYRLHYCGRLCETTSQWPQALALYNHADEFVAKAVPLMSGAAAAALATSALPDTAEATAQLARLNRGRRAIVKADALMQSKSEPAATTPSASSAAAAGSLAGAASSTAAVEHRLHEAVDLTGADVTRLRLVDLPPSFEIAPIKPVFFDVAENYIEPPALGHRYEAKAGGNAGGGLGGLLSGWFGGGKK